MHSYNRMAERINTLIKIVYKNKIKEQEMTVARQRAELLALRSQINPHFLFNTLECIRMHSVLRKENDTADMIEKLAVLEAVCGLGRRFCQSIKGSRACENLFKYTEI